DESDEQIRIVLVPRSRNVDPDLLKESLFKLTDMETRFGLNMNVLSAGQIPNVLDLRSVLKQWLEHRVEVLIRRSQHRLGKIEHRLEVLDGYLIAFLNIDEVIRIIRFEDEPKAKLIETFSLSDVQAEAILNLRLRSLSKLEEVEIRAEHKRLSDERRELKKLLKSEDMQWARIADEVKATRKAFGKGTEIGQRRSSFADAPEIDVDLDAALIEREPITVILSEKGWVRAMKGHHDDLSRLDFKQGDKLRFAVKAQTTDKILVFSTNGRFYTLPADQLPGGRGHGEPLRLMIDLDETHAPVSLFVHKPGRKLIVASAAGYGFVVPEDEVIASTRKGKQVLNVSSGDEAAAVAPAVGDWLAALGTNRKLLVFPLADVNEMTRGKGVILQRVKGAALADVRVFDGGEGLSWLDSAGRSFTVSLADLADWQGQRAQAGKLVMKGFPRANRFGPHF
ncbi:MAG: DNA gyrase subunit A, partial [Pseudomonadota bacterium]